MEFRVNSKMTSKGTGGCFKGRWLSADNLFSLQTWLHDCSFSPWSSGVCDGVCWIWFATGRTPFKTALTFLGKEEIFTGVVPSWGGCSSPAPSRVRLVIHPLCKSSWKVFAMHEKELGCSWSTGHGAAVFFSTTYWHLPLSQLSIHRAWHPFLNSQQQHYSR